MFLISNLLGVQFTCIATIFTPNNKTIQGRVDPSWEIGTLSYRTLKDLNQKMFMSCSFSWSHGLIERPSLRFFGLIFPDSFSSGSKRHDSSEQFAVVLDNNNNMHISNQPIGGNWVNFIAFHVFNNIVIAKLRVLHILWK